jgi:hypothetical protein
MPIDQNRFRGIWEEIEPGGVELVAVSKTKPTSDIKELYDLGQRDFGENYVQELIEKRPLLPEDIRWHFIGHLQSNKVKQILPFVHLIHGVDSLRLLQEITKQAIKEKRQSSCLLQVHIAEEETKFGFDEQELEDIFRDHLPAGDPCLRICGLMGMASFSNEPEKIRKEFQRLKVLYDQYAKIVHPVLSFKWLSMGMSGDYRIAIEEGSNMVRIGSLIFGERVKI